MISFSFVRKIRLTSESLKNLQRTMSGVAETFLAVKRKELEEEDGQLAANDSVEQSFHGGRPPLKKPPVINRKRKNLSKDEWIDFTDERGNDLTFDMKYFETSYYFEGYLRKVYPYYYQYKAFCKRRWIGRRLMDVITDEFRVLKEDMLKAK